MDIIDSSSEKLKSGLDYVMENKDKLLNGFGLSMGIIFLIISAAYVFVSYYLKKMPCDDKLALYGYVMAGLYLVGAISLLYLGKSKWSALLFAFTAAAVFFIRIYGFYLLLGDDGMLCRAVGGSQLWLAIMILSILNLAGLGKFIL